MLSGGGAVAEVDTDSANYMMPVCRENSPSKFGYGLCSGLITATFYWGKGICAPTEVTGGQIRSVVVQFIDSRPARMHEDFKILALEAMKAAWPCKR
jgi:Rap1a immunity proteins